MNWEGNVLEGLQNVEEKEQLIRNTKLKGTADTRFQSFREDFFQNSKASKRSKTIGCWAQYVNTVLVDTVKMFIRKVNAMSGWKINV